MSSIVQHNMSAMNANRMLSITASKQQKSTEKLSSGYRINRAGDDAAGLAISEKMRGQIKGLNRASANSQDGISMIQTAEGALTETHSIIQRMRELAVQASNDTNTDDDRTQIQNEIDQLTQEVDRIATTTEFNTKKLLNGDRAGAVDEKAGKANVDSTFANSTVSASITTNGAAKASFSDVIRVEITKNFEKGQSTEAKAKLTDSDIDLFNKVIISGGGDAGVTFKDDLGNEIVVSTNPAPSSANSTEENIKVALSGAKSTLQAQESNAAKSASLVSKNEDALEKAVDDIFKLASKVKDTDDNTFIAKNVTKDDVKKAINDLVSAYVKDGIAPDVTTQTSTSATSNDITEATNNLKKLFTTEDEEHKAGAAVIVADGYSLASKGYKEAGGEGAEFDYDALALDNPVANTTTFKTIATDVSGDLATLAKQMATVMMHDNNNNATVKLAQSVVDTLSNTDLSKAVVDYKTALADYKKNVTENPTATDDKKAEYQAKVDSAKATLDNLNKDESVITVSDLFGNSSDKDKFSIASKLDDNNKLTINMKNKSGDDTVITIENADRLKAGDVITITSEAMVESKQAATGKEAFRLQVGANAGQEVSLGINSMKAKDLNLVQTKEGVEGKALDVTTQAGASMAVNAYDLAIQKVSTERAKMGAMQNRLEHTIANLDSAAENTQNAESRIRDTDMASEMVEFSKNNILAQAGQSMLAQANQSNQGVLSLLG